MGNSVKVEDETILQAMELLDKVSTKILFVHNNGRLLAAITDGDIRRWIIKGGKLTESIKVVANYQPIYLKEKESRMATKQYTIPYGVIKASDDGEIQSFEEKPQMSFYVNTGCYFVEPRVIEELEEDAPIDFTDIIEKYRTKGERVSIYPISEDDWLDMGQFEELEHMRGCM